MKRWKLIACFVVVFVAGAVVGGAISLEVMRNFFLRPPSPAEMETKILAELRSELKLTEEQVKLIRPTVAKTASEVAFYHRSAFRKIGEILRDSDEEIKRHLDAEQVARFEKMQAHRPHAPED